MSNTPEQLADRAANIGDLFDHQIEALGPELAYELRRLAAENAALRAEAMRFREDALNEKAARKALESVRSQQQGEAVLDALNTLCKMLHSGEEVEHHR